MRPRRVATRATWIRSGVAIAANSAAATRNPVVPVGVPDTASEIRSVDSETTTAAIVPNSIRTPAIAARSRLSLLIRTLHAA